MKDPSRIATTIIGFIIGAGVCYLFIVILSLFFPALAHAPEDTDPANADWFRSLSQPGMYGGSCCKESDCHVTTDVEIKDEHYYVRDPDVTGSASWLPVPENRILKRYDNPTGKYVACVFNHMVLCFVLVEGI